METGSRLSTLPEKGYLIGEWRIREGYVVTDKTHSGSKRGCVGVNVLKSLRFWLKRNIEVFKLKLGPVAFVKVTIFRGLQTPEQYGRQA